jgi:hypothetical protein
VHTAFRSRGSNLFGCPPAPSRAAIGSHASARRGVRRSVGRTRVERVPALEGRELRLRRCRRAAALEAPIRSPYANEVGVLLRKATARKPEWPRSGGCQQELLARANAPCGRRPGPARKRQRTKASKPRRAAGPRPSNRAHSAAGSRGACAFSRIQPSAGNAAIPSSELRPQPPLEISSVHVRRPRAPSLCGGARAAPRRSGRGSCARRSIVLAQGSPASTMS